MFDDLASWLRALHIFAFAAWMAVMFYLPRLLVYHADVAVGSETSQTFKVMERRLLRAIGTPSMIVVFVVGIWLATVQGFGHLDPSGAMSDDYVVRYHDSTTHEIECATVKGGSH